MCSCYSILECYNLFSGVELSIRSFYFICQYCVYFVVNPNISTFLGNVSFGLL